ncbi:MAG: Beta-hexosamidase precursor [Paenibacillus sp.]|nr:Beta-hexosamidase precursor [Paenibacillus sp.]
MGNKALELWKKMTLRQKLGQMVCIRGYRFQEGIHRRLSDGAIGGAAANMFNYPDRSFEAVIERTKSYLDAASMPLLLECDPESGLTQFAFGTRFPTMMALGATRSTELAYKLGNAIASEAKAVGFYLIGSPVLDVNTNGMNPIINTRAIGDEVEIVIELGGAYVKGVHAAGVIAAGKHFPGHGDTDVDSHIEMPTVTHTREHLTETELKPFQALFEQGMTAIMTAHIYYPALVDAQEEGLPATLSKRVMTSLLRDEMGFTGIAVSDSLTMRAVKEAYGIGPSAIMAVRAGNDIILQDYDSDPELTFTALEEAVHSGEISMEIIDTSVQRILHLKETFGLLDNPVLDIEEARSIIHCAEHQAVSQEIAEKSVTLLESFHLPLTASNTKRMLLITTRSTAEGTAAQDMGQIEAGKQGYLASCCREHVNEVDLCYINEESTTEQLEQILNAINSPTYDAVILGLFTNVSSYRKGSGTLGREQIEFIQELISLKPDIIILLFGSPYLLREFQGMKNVLCMYGSSNNELNASIKVLFGYNQATGKLPITINEKYKFGFGL